jgi:hypothetical protein
MALHNILHVEENIMVMQICSSWASTGGDAGRVAKGLRVSPDRIRKEIERLKSLGVLLEGGKLDSDVDKYLNTVLGNKLLKIVPKKT